MGTTMAGTTGTEATTEHTHNDDDMHGTLAFDTPRGTALDGFIETFTGRTGL